MLTPANLEILKKLADSEDKEILCDGGTCYIDIDRIDKRHVMKLLAVTAISDISDVKGVERYALNSTGRAILFNPEIQHQILEALLHSGQGAFTIENDTVRPI